MLSSVLRSKQAVAVNIEIMRAFVHLREILASNREVAAKLSELERHIATHDKQIHTIFEQLDANGVPTIVSTNMKVVELVMAQLAHGWSPEELHFQHPYLSLGQIYSALAYYWDHKAELDEDIERRRQYAEEERSNAGTSPLANKLREQNPTAGP